MKISTKGLISSLTCLALLLAANSSFADDTVNIPNVGNVPKKTLEIAGGTTAGVVALGTGAYAYSRYRRFIPKGEHEDFDNPEWLGENYQAWGPPAENSPPWVHDQYANYRSTLPDDEPDYLARPEPSQTPAELASATGHEGFNNGSEAAIRGDSAPSETGPASDDFRSGYDYRAGRTAAISGAKAPTAGIDSPRFQLGYHTGADDTEATNDYHNGIRQRLADEASAEEHNFSLENADTDSLDEAAGIRWPDEEPIRTGDLKPPEGASDDFRAGYYTSEDNLGEYEEGLRRGENDLPISSGNTAPNPHRTLGYNYQESGMTAESESGINPLDSRVTDLYANANKQPKLTFHSDEASGDSETSLVANEARNAAAAETAQVNRPTVTTADANSAINQRMLTNERALSNNLQFVTDSSEDAEQGIEASNELTAAENAGSGSSGSVDDEPGDELPEILPE